MHNFVIQIVFTKPAWKCAEENIPFIFWTQNFKEKTQLFYVLYLNYPGVLQTKQLKYIVMKLHKGLKLHT